MSDHGFIALGKYSSARDSILHYMAISDWANASDGNVEAPTGYFWRISNTPADVQQGNTEFSSLLEEWLTDSPEVTDSPALRAELVGHFLLVETDQGFVEVYSYATEAELLKEYEYRESVFSEWNADE